MASFQFGGGSNQPQQTEFTNQSTVYINHGKGYFPSIWIVVGGYIIMANVQHLTTNTVKISFCENLTGTIYIR